MAVKSEQPTPHRLQEARRKGQVAVSRDLSGGVVFVVAFGALALGASAWVGGLVSYLAASLAAAFTVQSPMVAGGRAMNAAVSASLPTLVSATVAAGVVGLMQTKGLFSWDALRVDLGRVSPKASRVVSGAALVEVGKGLLKVSAAALLVWLTVRPMLRPIANLTGVSPRGLLLALGRIGARVGWRLGLLMLVLGLLDYVWQRRRHLRSLRMTRDEVKREFKDAEGDPRHKAERQRLHRDLLEQRMIEDVRKADFVVVNPDHIAVAIRYERDREAAPVVVAKGERFVAERIKAIARDAGVPIFRDVSLARSLRDVQEGDEIPEALYEAVAEILRVLGDESQAGAVTAPLPAEAPSSLWKRV